MKILSRSWALLLAVPILLGTCVVALAAPSDSVTFKVDRETAVPGAVLAPGSYTVRVVNSLSDRVLLKLSGGSVNTMFLGVAEKGIGTSSGVMMWDNASNGVSYVRGVAFLGSHASVEFVYPKDDAVKIAQANAGKVPAVDPASEGKPADDTLSQKDMELLNLWVLHVDKVGTEGGGIKAEHFMPVAATKPRPVVAALPHTGSMMPLAWVAGVMSLVGAGVLRLASRSRRKSSVATSA